MGFFRKLGTRSKKSQASQDEQRFLAASRDAIAHQTYTRPNNETTFATVSTYQTASSEYNHEPPNFDSDFDDAASYHSTSSIPSASNASGTQGQSTMLSRYQYMARHGQNLAGASGRDINSFYSTIEEPNEYGVVAGTSRSTQLRHDTDHDQRIAAQQSSRRTRKSVQEAGDEYFQQAVRFHEDGDLVSATAYFKRAADTQNPLGMLFYGLSLRHGWGCQPNEKIAFLYLQKAGERVIPNVKDMNPSVAGMAKEELAMAIYELGQSYRHGWGVSRNKKTAAYYFEIAAELGDADAQADVAACYESGDGVKRDMKKAAHYFRLAHKQGHQIFGTSWIFKKKYDSD